jgi:predicted TIM-barrel fold metal-dependent hydrolase
MESFRNSDTVELRKNVAEAQSKRWAEAVTRLMERSDDNIELTNALNELTRVIDHKSYFGQLDKQLSEGYMNKLTELLKEAAEVLERK